MKFVFYQHPAHNLPPSIRARKRVTIYTKFLVTNIRFHLTTLAHNVTFQLYKNREPHVVLQDHDHKVWLYSQDPLYPGKAHTSCTAPLGLGSSLLPSSPSTYQVGPSKLVSSCTSCTWWSQVKGNIFYYSQILWVRNCCWS